MFIGEMTFCFGLNVLWLLLLLPQIPSIVELIRLMKCAFFISGWGSPHWYRTKVQLVHYDPKFWNCSKRNPATGKSRQVSVVQIRYCLGSG